MVAREATAALARRSRRLQSAMNTLVGRRVSLAILFDAG